MLEQECALWEDAVCVVGSGPSAAEGLGARGLGPWLHGKGQAHTRGLGSN